MALSPRARRAYKLFALGLTFKQIGQRMGVSDQHAQRLVLRARQDLVDQLAEEGARYRARVLKVLKTHGLKHG